MKPATFDPEARIVECDLRLTLIGQLRENLLASEMPTGLRARQLEGLGSLEAATKRTRARARAILDRAGPSSAPLTNAAMRRQRVKP
jgi:hypothetical protein